jgi:phosphatidate cytidylyltransferase
VKQRVISAAVLVPVVVVLFLLGPPWLTLAIALLAALAAYEVTQLMSRAGLESSRVIPTVATPLFVLGLAAALGTAAPSDVGYLLFALSASIIAGLIILAAVQAFRQQDPSVGFKSWVGTVMATLYPSLLGFAAVFAGISPAPQTGSLFGFHLDTGRIVLLILVLTVWTLDSGAYLSGKAFPRGHFMNHISPNKTWSGAIGGTIAAIVVASILWWGSGESFLIGAVLGVVIAVAAQAGDLAESLVKRAAGAKDSGTLIPGHGGFLDRVDSFLFAAPAMYTTLILYSLLFSVNPS